METPDPRPPDRAVGSGSRRAERRSTRRTPALLAAAGVVSAGLVVAALALVTSGSPVAGVDDVVRVADPQPQRESAEPRKPRSTAPQMIVPARPLSRSIERKAAKRASLLAERAEQMAAAAAAGPVRVASFNMLGASHTSGKNGRPGFADGVTRARQAASLVASLGIEVFGAQEFEPSQQGVFASQLPQFATYPGRQLSEFEGANTIAWDTGRFKALQTETIGIPYFGGKILQMPYVLLQDIGSGQKIWFANFHNPADVRGNAQRWRNSATAIEADLANRLSSDGTPVIMTGDFNERAEFFCRLSARAPTMKSASGATGGSSCFVPRGAQVDWVLGSESVGFEQYQMLDGGQIDRITDHPVIVADASFAQR